MFEFRLGTRAEEGCFKRIWSVTCTLFGSSSVRKHRSLQYHPRLGILWGSTFERVSYNQHNTSKWTSCNKREGSRQDATNYNLQVNRHLALLSQCYEWLVQIFSKLWHPTTAYLTHYRAAGRPPYHVHFLRCKSSQFCQRVVVIFTPEKSQQNVLLINLLSTRLQRQQQPRATSATTGGEVIQLASTSKGRGGCIFFTRCKSNFARISHLQRVWYIRRQSHRPWLYHH